MRLRVGLTGGIGAGKSLALERFAELGALTVDADALARAAVAPGTPGLARVLARWPQARAGDGSLNRAALASIVFADPTARAELDAIVHPIVRVLGRELESQAGADQIVVHEVPLLFETGFAGLCDATVLVTAPVAARVDRAAARSGLAREDVARRIGAQIDPRDARRLATFVIENDGTCEDLRAAVDRVWGQLLAMPARREDTDHVTAANAGDGGHETPPPTGDTMEREA